MKPDFLEKILMDFGVSGSIKKVSHGPVVTLNEFEPAAGIKVSKIINLSDDIARNTSSESARIATIPGSNTVGIELPNNSRENVYLREILDHVDFKKREIKLPIALGKNISGKPIVGGLNFNAPSFNRWNYWIRKIGLYQYYNSLFTLPSHSR
jgi:S-DNA-T family DNA segregation ATPase FtsK/SpoIIIE